jgi:hypothetical protein
MIQNGRDAQFATTVTELHRIARLREWFCRRWTQNQGQVDSCPDCKPSFRWGSPMARDLLKPDQPTPWRKKSVDGCPNRSET